MNKKFIGAALVAAVLAGTFTACNQSKEEENVTPAAKAGEMKVAYVEYDSIMSQYQFCKDAEAALNQKSSTIDKQLQTEGQSIQAAAANFQQKYQNNGFSSAQEAQAVQAGIQKQAQALESKRQTYAQEFQKEQESYQKAVHDSIQHFLAVYNKDKKYSIIYSKSGDNLLYADKSMDITKEIVAGLNKAYKPAAKTDAKKADDTKKK